MKNNKSLTIRPAVDFEMLNGLAEAQGEGEPDLIVELIDLYLEDTPPRVAAMREALVNGDEVRLSRAAHALKGSSSTLGALQVADSCAEVEELAAALSLRDVPPVLDRLDAEIATLRSAFLVERLERSGQPA